jgi:hypothetical protein
MTVPPPGSGPGSAAVIDGVDVDAVAAAVRGCPGVSGLDGGQFGEVASYLPGRKVEGVVISGGRVTVRVRATWGMEAPVLAALIATVLAPLTAARPVDVVIGDIDDPPGPQFPRVPARAAYADPCPGLPSA